MEAITVTFGSNHTAKHTHSLPLAWCWKTNKKNRLTHDLIVCSHCQNALILIGHIVDRDDDNFAVGLYLVISSRPI